MEFILRGYLIKDIIIIIIIIIIYVTTGDNGCSDVQGMQVSVNQRVEGITSQLPTFYCMVRPRISLVPGVAANGVGEGRPSYAVNWSEGDCSLEVVDGLEGKTVEE